MRQLMNFAKSYIGNKGFSVFVSLILLLPSLVFLIFIIRSRTGLGRFFMLFGIVIISLSLIWQIEIPEEKIHLLEFAVLGWLALKDTFVRQKKFKGASLALGFTFSIGVLDEVFQAILPYRYFQGQDILLNGLGSLLGAILFLSFIRGKE